MASKRLLSELKQLTKESSYLYYCEPTDNILLWNITIFGPQDTLYENGIFHGSINFPNEYPIKPPIVIINNIIHPNIHKTGHVCISILHEGSDEYGYEDTSLRWSPSHSINSIMLSIILLLSCPNFDSPANIDASVLCKNHPDEYRKLVYSMVAKSH
jgi:ubiquitin-protein ligase